MTLIAVIAAQASSAPVRILKDAVNTDHSISVLSPAPDAAVGTQTLLSAQLSGEPADTYDMFWYVDNGTWNWMGTNPTNQQKQAVINFSNWTWQQSDYENDLTEC